MQTTSELTNLTEDMMTKLNMLYRNHDNSLANKQKIIDEYFDKILVRHNNVDMYNNIKTEMKSMLINLLDKVHKEDYNHDNKDWNNIVLDCKAIFLKNQINNSNKIILDDHSKALMKTFFIIITLIHYSSLNKIKTHFDYKEFSDTVLGQNKLILEEREAGYTSGEDYERDINRDKLNTAYNKTPMYQYNSAAIHSVANQSGNGASFSYTISDFNNGNYKAICTIADNIIRQINENVNTDKKSQNRNNNRFSDAKHINADKCKPSVLQINLATKFLSKMQKMYIEAEINGQIETVVDENHKIFIMPSGYGALPFSAAEIFPKATIIASDRSEDAVSGVAEYFEKHQPEYKIELSTTDVSTYKMSDNIRGKCQFLISCPPYYRAEYYPDKNKSLEWDKEINQNYNEWKQKLLIPFIETSDCLEPNGIGCFIFSTKDGTVKDVIKILEDKGFNIIYIKDSSNNKKQPVTNRSFGIFFSRNSIYKENAEKRVHKTYGDGASLHRRDDVVNGGNISKKVGDTPKQNRYKKHRPNDILPVNDVAWVEKKLKPNDSEPPCLAPQKKTFCNWLIFDEEIDDPNFSVNKNQPYNPPTSDISDDEEEIINQPYNPPTSDISDDEGDKNNNFMRSFPKKKYQQTDPSPFLNRSQPDSSQPNTSQFFNRSQHNSSQHNTSRFFDKW
jgi:tRNA1(Val) A37 N6-methylase TrmN6